MKTELIKAQLKAVIAMAESILLELDNDVCQHPQEERIDLSTMGHKRWQCGVCGYIYDPDGGE